MPNKEVVKSWDANAKLKQAREDERGKRSVTDSLLIANARKSPDEIEAATGIPAAEALERLANILRTRDWMTDRMEERLLLIEMSDLIDTVKGRMEHASMDNFADIANVALRGYEGISKRLTDRRKLTEDDMNEISRAQAEMFMEALRVFISMQVEYLIELHPELDVDWENDIYASYENGWRKAYEQVKGNIRE